MLKTSGGRIRLAAGLLLAGAFCIQCQKALRAKPADSATRDESLPLVAQRVYAEPIVNPPVLAPVVDHTDTARTDPVEFLRSAIQNYDRQIRDYTCTFTRTERIGSRLTAEQVTEVRFRQNPFSVMMHWVKNPDKAERVIYIEGRNDGKAIVRPAGSVVQLLVKSIRQPIDSPLAKQTSRRQIDQFGFRQAMELGIKYYLLGKERGDAVELTCQGEETVNDRPAIKIVRKLPDSPDYPDQSMEMYVDKEWQVPTYIICRDARGELLGQYRYTDVRFNVGLTEADFDPKTYGM